MRTAIRHSDLPQIGGQALIEVLQSLLSFGETEVTPADGDIPAPDHRVILGTVTLAGRQASGAVCIQVTEDFATRAASRLFGGRGSGPVTHPEADDLIGEFCNMVAGRVAAKLGQGGQPCTLGTPVIARGSRLPPEGEASHERGRTDWTCHGDRITVEVRFHPRPS